MKFAARIGLVVILASLVVTPLLGFAIFTNARDVLEKNIVSNAVDLAEALMRDIDHGLYIAYRDIAMIADGPQLEDLLEAVDKGEKLTSMEADDLARELTEMAQLTGPWQMLTTYSAAGKVVISSGPIGVCGDVNKCRLSQTAFKAALKGRVYYSDMVVSDITGNPTVIYAAPIFREPMRDAVIGVVIGHYAWGAVLQILDDAPSAAIFHLFNRDGLTIAAPTAYRSHILKKPIAALKQTGPELPINAAAYALYSTPSREGMGEVLAVRTMQHGLYDYLGSGWGLQMEVPRDDAFAPVRRMAWSTAFSIAGALALLATILAVMGRRFIRPLNELAAVARRFGRGNMDERMAVGSDDEIGDVARSFNVMAEDLTRTMVSKERLQALVAERTHELQNLKDQLEVRVEERTGELRREIAERQRVEEKVKESEVKYRRVYELNPDAFAISRLDDGLYVDVNHGFTTLTGYQQEEAIGVSSIDLGIWGREEDRLNLIAELHAEGSASNIEIELRRKDGTIIPCLISATLIMLNDEPHLLTATKNVTELNDAKQQAEAASLAKSSFLSSMSHELRTPMNAILGFGQMLEYNPKEPLTPMQQRCVDNIAKGGQHLLNLINDILDLARIEAGKVDLEFKRVSTAVVLKECLSMVGSMAKSRGIVINAPDAAAAEMYVVADETRFTQVLLNLLSNAVKYNRNDGRVDIEFRDAGAGRLRIAVGDTGDGIPEESHGLLFQPFQRLSAADSNIEGTGIGLTVTKQLVELMGGFIGVESRVGEGSTFWFELPLAKPPSEDDEPADADVQRLARTLPRIGGLLLYVEDNPANLELMELIVLRVDGLRMISAHNAEFGLQLARDRDPDVIILDINLPGMNGFEALKELRKSPKTEHIPVFALSAAATRADIENGIKAGFRAYMTKPVRIEEVVGAIKSVLGER